MTTARKKKRKKAAEEADLTPIEHASESSMNSDSASEYNRVVAAARLEGITLFGLSFFVTPEYFEQDREKLELSYLCEVTHPPPNEAASGIFEWCLRAKIGDEVFLECTANYAIAYSNLDNFDAEAIQQFVDRVGRYATYPYFRAQAAALNWSANVHLPTLPVLKST